jgi:hypothetical protein
MKLVSLALAGSTLALFAVPTASVAQQGHASQTRQCGSFKFGLDGYQPGPSGITATNVGCWEARAIALLGPAPGWRCRLAEGLTFTCRRGKATISYFGE